MKTTWPSPAEEELTDSISLDEYLIRNRPASFMLTVSGESMIGAGIYPGDVLIIERGKRPNHGDIVIANIDGSWAVRRLEKYGQHVQLVSENPKMPPIAPNEEMMIDGVVVGVARKYK